MPEVLQATCGNCGKAVGATEVTCPHCGVLLAAYQSPSGAATGDALATSAVTSVAAPVEPAAGSSRVSPPAPPVTPSPPPSRAYDRPTSSVTTSEPIRLGDPIAPENVADELSEMATSTSGFAQQVEAELKDAKVVFDGGRESRIETTPEAPDVPLKEDAAKPTQAAKPEARATRPANAGTNAKPKPVRTTGTTNVPRAQTMLNPDWLPGSTASKETQRIGESPLAPGAGKQSALKNPYILGLGFIFFMAIVFNSPRAALFLIIAIVLGVVFFSVVLSASKSNSRSTTQMPYDKPDWRKRK